MFYLSVFKNLYIFLQGVITWGSHALTEALKRFNRAEAEEEKNRWAKTLMKITERSYTTITKNAGVGK